MEAIDGGEVFSIGREVIEGYFYIFLSLVVSISSLVVSISPFYFPIHSHIIPLSSFLSHNYLSKSTNIPFLKLPIYLLPKPFL